MKRRPWARKSRSNGVKGAEAVRKLWMPEQRTRVSSQKGECEPNQRSQRAKGVDSVVGVAGRVLLLSIFFLFLGVLLRRARASSAPAAASVVCLHPPHFLAPV